jgi:mannosyl-oligosaccharide alpha-1,3-glucosidase
VQEAIHDALNKRYDIVLYLYTLFYQHKLTAEPLWRAMWNEFPDQEATYKIDTQFMVGDAYLVVPKIHLPDLESSMDMPRWMVDFYLPEDELWYNEASKLVDTAVGSWRKTLLSNMEQLVFMRGGSIVPILQHEGCLALLNCYQNDFRLNVYPDANRQATGGLYLDDGLTLDYSRDPDASLYLQFDFAQNTTSATLSVTNVNKTQYKGFGKEQYLTSVYIYG